MSEERSGKWHYYASGRGCLTHPDSLDEIGVGLDLNGSSCCLTIRLMGFKSDPRRHYTMVVCAHSDEWEVFKNCPDVLEMLARNGIKSGEMRTVEPFYDLQKELEEMGYKNLGKLRE